MRREGWLLLLHVLFVPVLVRAGEVEELLEANESAVQLLHDIQLHGANDVEFWAWSRGAEKARHRVWHADPNGRFASASDELFLGSGEYQVLQGWDSKSPPDLKPWDQKGVIGQVILRDPYPVHEIQSLMLAEQLHLAFHWQDKIGSGAISQLLVDFVKRASKTELLGEVDKNGRKVKQLRVYFPGVNELPPDGSYYDFFIDPASNFMVTAYLGHYKTLEVYIGGQGAEGKKRVERMKSQPLPLPIEIWSEALEMKDFGGGVFLPVKIKAGGNNTQNGQLVLGDGVMSAIERLEVNVPIPPEAFEFKFPENLIVSRLGTGSKAGAIQPHGELWGSDNRPKMASISAQQILQLRADSERSGWGYLGWVAGAAVLGGILYLIKRSRRRHDF